MQTDIDNQLPSPIPALADKITDELDEALKLKLKDQLFKLISTHGCDTFAEIQSHNLEGFRGEFIFTWENRPDLVLWACLSEEAIAAFTELLYEKKIFPHPANPLIYVFDGMMPDLPIAKRPRTQYKKQHWLPIFLRTRPVQLR